MRPRLRIFLHSPAARKHGSCAHQQAIEIVSENILAPEIYSVSYFGERVSSLIAQCQSESRWDGGWGVGADPAPSSTILVLVRGECDAGLSAIGTMERTTKMRTRLAKLTQSDAKRLFKAAVEAGVDLRLEFRPDGAIIATAHKPAEVDGADALPSDSPEEIRKLV